LPHQILTPLDNAAHISLPFVPGRHHLPRRPFAIHVGLMHDVLMSTGDEYKRLLEGYSAFHLIVTEMVQQAI
jgi:hypothetical protein